MNDKKSRFYGWLVGKLEHRKMTMREIRDEWAEAANNVNGEELTDRTFHRNREEINSMFGIEIYCDKGDGCRYAVRRDECASTDNTDWMLSALRISSLGDMLKYHGKVMLEKAPGNSEYLDDILSAIDKRHTLRFRYTTAYDCVRDMMLAPCFVRLFHQRWYVISNAVTDGGGDDYNPRVLPFDRISDMEVVYTKRDLPREVKEKLTPDSFYDDCFGIIHQDEVDAQDVVIRAFYPEYNYLNEVRLHESQTVICEGKDYVDYKLHLRPTRDFIQELLWHGRKITVLSPESLRQEMITILKDMTESYSSGKNTLEE